MPYPEAIAHYPKSTRLVIQKFYNRIFKKNKNALVVFVGETGGGKSYSAISLMCGLYLYRDGKLPDDDFLVHHCKFRMLDFMKDMNNEQTMQRGDVWVFDEAGIDAGNQDYATIKNKVISWYAQTCRNQHQIIFFTLPTLGMLTPQVRKLLHYYMEAVWVDEKNKVGVIKPLEMQYNTRLDKLYYHRFKSVSRLGVQEVELIGCPLVHQSLLDKYEKQKKEFTRDLNTEIQTILEMLNQKKDNQEAKIKGQSTIELKRLMTEAYSQGYTTTAEIAKHLGMTQSALSKRGGLTLLWQIKHEFEQKNQNMGVLQPQNPQNTPA